MTTISTDQSDSAAERSAHVSRGKHLETLVDLKPAVVKLADGSWKLRVLHEAEQRAVKARNDALGEAVSVIEQMAVKTINGEYETRLPRCVVTMSDCIAKINAMRTNQS